MSVSAPEMTATKIKELVSVQPYSITLITTFIHYEPKAEFQQPVSELHDLFL